MPAPLMYSTFQKGLAKRLPSREPSSVIRCFSSLPIRMRPKATITTPPKSAVALIVSLINPNIYSSSVELWHYFMYVDMMVWILAFWLQHRVWFTWLEPVKIWKPTDASIPGKAGNSPDELVLLRKTTHVIKNLHRT